MMERPGVGVGVFVFKEGKFFMLKRKGAHGEGTWSLPGGHLEFGESIEDCAKREVMEELGIMIKNIKKTVYTNDVFEKEGKHYITLFVLSEWASGIPSMKEKDKADEVGLYTWENLPEPLFLPLKNLSKEDFYPLKEFRKA